MMNKWKSNREVKVHEVRLLRNNGIFNQSGLRETARVCFRTCYRHALSTSRQLRWRQVQAATVSNAIEPPSGLLITFIYCSVWKRKINSALYCLYFVPAARHVPTEVVLSVLNVGLVGKHKGSAEKGHRVQCQTATPAPLQATQSLFDYCGFFVNDNHFSRLQVLVFVT